ncbi:MAG: hypothetical protein AAGF78_13460 [Pseudomonadota bacterium]
MDRRAFLLGAPALLAACSTKPRVFESPSAVSAAQRPNTGVPLLEVFTSFNVSSDNGAHSALFIHADQRVVFDPAGTFAHPQLPEQHDVIFGMSDSAREVFVDYHTRETFWTTLQSFQVPAATAAFALREARHAGPVSDAFCTRSVSSILAAAPGMPMRVRTTWFPNRLHDQLVDVPGVRRQEFRQFDDADKEKFWENNDITL